MSGENRKAVVVKPHASIEADASTFKPAKDEKEMEAIRKRNNVRVYVCGGGAGSIISNGLQNAVYPTIGFAQSHLCYIDTSDSDIVGKVGDEQCYLFKGKDGSGQLRKTNFDDIVAYTKEIVQKFPAGDLNIIVASMAGGSGSAISHELARELLKRNEQVIVLAIGSTHTKNFLRNTISTLKTFDSVCQTLDVSIAMYYRQNPSRGDTSYTRASVDDDICKMVTRLHVLYSGQNGKLDSKDLEHFLNFGIHSNFRKGLVALNCHQQDVIDGVVGHNDITVASLLASADTDPAYYNPASVPAEYQTYGVLPEGIDQQVVDQLPMHFVLSEGFLHDTLDVLEVELSKIQDVADSRVSRGSIVKKSDLPNGSDVLL